VQVRTESLEQVLKLPDCLIISSAVIALQKSPPFRNQLRLALRGVDGTGRVPQSAGLKCSHKKTIINSINTYRASQAESLIIPDEAAAE